jgi:chitinase
LLNPNRGRYKLLTTNSDDVPADKINLGFGFYGRSFQLSDPSCYKPGCMFKGGADPGSCSKNSGTLSFREIQSIIDQFDIEPYWDKDAAVKYITWNQDQWVSYDDEDTFKQKLEYGNKLGIGGMLIWSIDQDTDDLKALSALLAPKDVKAKGEQANDAAFWQDVSSADCYVSDCGGSCKAGFLSITKQPCGGAKPVSRHSEEKDSSLCCPITAAPDPDKCTWRGTAPSCNGHCHDNEVTVELNRWGDGKYCEDGNKAYCCEVSDRSYQCYWTGVGKDCNSGDELFTFAGTFLESIVDVLDVFPPTLVGDALQDALSLIDWDLQKRYCCPPDDAKKWKNCAWHGEPGSCFDNHCDLGHQVQLTSHDHGLGESCFPRSERTRVYCCDAADGETPFLPVPLEDLFPHPPEGDDVNVDSSIQVDNTWGTGEAETSDDAPNDSTFGFVVLASPKEIQISLDKRDGADWEVFNCNDATSEEAQTIQIYCSNDNTTKCDEIHLGHGVPGTVLEMPPGCGPSRYAVAKSLVTSDKQHFPNHLEKRTYAHKPTIYDLTFDFEWQRVPRDLGETQMRLDYSNEIGYWVSPTECTEIMCYLGVCVLSENKKRKTGGCIFVG